MVNQSLEALRAQVKARHAAATKKASRLRRMNGVEVAGTQFDVRRNPANIKRYNRTQLEAYLKQLNDFTSRSNAFIAGADGAPLPKAKWRLQEKLRESFNRKVEKHMESVGDIHIPTANMTIRQRQEHLMNAAAVRAKGNATNNPYVKVVRNPRNVKDADALDAFIIQLKKKNDKNYLPEQIKASRKEAYKMMQGIGISSMNERISKLSDHQFAILWNESNFPMALSGKYEVVQKQNMEDDGRHLATVDEDFTNDAKEYLSWAESLPTQTTSRKKK